MFIYYVSDTLHISPSLSLFCRWENQCGFFLFGTQPESQIDKTAKGHTPNEWKESRIKPY